MKTNEIITLNLHPLHKDKITKGGTVQLSHEQLHNAIINEPNCELHFAKKHVSQILKAHQSGKGIRIHSDKLQGGTFY